MLLLKMNMEMKEVKLQEQISFLYISLFNYLVNFAEHHKGHDHHHHHHHDHVHDSAVSSVSIVSEGLLDLDEVLIFLYYAVCFLALHSLDS